MKLDLKIRASKKSWTFVLAWESVKSKIVWWRKRTWPLMFLKTIPLLFSISHEGLPTLKCLSWYSSHYFFTNLALLIYFSLRCFASLLDLKTSKICWKHRCPYILTAHLRLRSRENLTSCISSSFCYLIFFKMSHLIEWKNFNL